MPMKVFSVSAILFAIIFLSSSFTGKGIRVSSSVENRIAFIDTSVKIKISRLCTGWWYMDQVVNVLSGKYTQFKRGGQNTTGITYQNLRIRLFKNGKAIHIDQNGNRNEAEWHFLNSAQNELVYTAYTPGRVVNIWEMLEVNEKYLYFTTHLSNTNNENDVEVIRMVNGAHIKSSKK